MEPEGSLPHSQQPATYPYPDLDSVHAPPNPTSQRSILILSTHLRLGVCPPKPGMHFSSPQYVLHALPTTTTQAQISTGFNRLQATGH